MIAREKIAARIRALLAKTVANGCTEDEAISAAAKASELLESYNLTLDEVEMRASPFTRHDEEHDDLIGDRMWKVADGIAYLTGTHYWTSARGVVPVVTTFFGFAHEVAIAGYLLDICGNAMRHEIGKQERRYGLLNPMTRRRRVAPFADGMADRLRERIRALKPTAPTGNTLVVLHGALVKAAIIDAGINLKDQRTKASRDLEGGYAAGRLAADLVGLNSGLNGPATTGRLICR